MPDNQQQYVKLENRLVLLAWLNSLLGYRSNRDLLADTKTVAEGFAADGHSHLYHHLIARGSRVSIPADDLARYDENIRHHLEKINRGRTGPITLRYFQHLAALYTEIFLDRLFHQRAQLLADLNAFVHQRNARRLPGEPLDDPFTDDDLTKLAYWMATGSGKTLILHFNYYQFLHYNTGPLDNILLITPNEGLSEQHLRELERSGIPAQRFSSNAGGLRAGSSNVVQIIEITKLVEEKRGGGISVPVEAFEGHNLIFVDEGHKGSGGEAWRKYRDALGKTGFTFEYSATFGQALSAARNDPLTAEYGKAIIFDYSYRYFYGDGFGKDFRILNLKEEVNVEQTDVLLLGNLLSFYEQLRLFEEQADALRPYNLEKPLWIFVGSTVNAVYTERGQRRSDVLTVVRFLHRVLQNRDWAIQAIGEVLAGRTGLVSPDGEDVFQGRFFYLRSQNASPEKLYEDILRRIFYAPSEGGLHLYDIRRSGGELGLRAFGADQYFGLIYVGDPGVFGKLVEEGPEGIVVEEDAISGSLFNTINHPNSPINILIGARKFIEGWDSWRVSSMGLLNIGRQEGSQIIQLFGRGVRLRGKDHLLKRSAALSENSHPPYLALLETLNIFAVRANYMAQFREYLEREGVETEPPIELKVPVRIQKEFLQRGLVIPRPQKGRDFKTEVGLLLEPDSQLSVQVDMSVRMQMLESTQAEFRATEVRAAGQPRNIPSASLDWVDWQQVYLDLLAYKERKGYSNLIIRPDVLRPIAEQKDCSIVADENVIHPRTWGDRARLQEAVTRLICRYVDRFYQTRRERWEKSAMIYQPLDEEDPNLNFNCGAIPEKPCPAYVIRLPRSEQKMVEAIQKLLEDLDRLYRQEDGDLPRIYFDRHLYLPILLNRHTEVQMTPPGLEDSEGQFIKDLREYWAEKHEQMAGTEIFLLRNLSRGHGVGFFEGRGFYPDFILWILNGTHQRIVFVEPHGMLHAMPYLNDEKARLHERLPDLAKEVGRRSGRSDVLLDAFIISATRYNELHKSYDSGNWSRGMFTEKHILFPERASDPERAPDDDPNYDYIDILLGTHSEEDCKTPAPATS
jgi:hypothetical protein